MHVILIIKLPTNLDPPLTRSSLPCNRRHWLCKCRPRPKFKNACHSQRERFHPSNSIFGRRLVLKSKKFLKYHDFDPKKYLADDQVNIAFMLSSDHVSFYVAQPLSWHSAPCTHIVGPTQMYKNRHCRVVVGLSKASHRWDWKIRPETPASPAFVSPFTALRCVLSFLLLEPK